MMQDPANLHVMGYARRLVAAVYRLTGSFPASERYGLTPQMRRAAISIGSNIAEGCGRNGDREFINFLHVALGSATELEFQILVATDLQFLSSEPPLLEDVRQVKRMLSRLIKGVRNRPPSAPPSR